MKFKVGDKVKTKKGIYPENKEGEIVFIYKAAIEYQYAVKFKDFNDGQDCLISENKIDCGNSGYFMEEHEMELIKRPIFNKENLTPHKIEKTDPIVEKVRQKLLDRSRLGIKKYGTTLEENNTDDFLVHALEEAMDLALYLQKEIDNKLK